MYVPDPPCCSIPGSRENCNESCCCLSIGRIGFDWFDRNRGVVMPILSILSFICLILSTVSLASLSHQNEVVKDTYWVYKSTSYSFIFNFFHFVFPF